MNELNSALIFMGILAGSLCLIAIGFAFFEAYGISYHREHTSAYQNAEDFIPTLGGFEDAYFGERTTQAMREFILKEAQGKIITISLIVQDVSSSESTGWGYGYSCYALSNNWRFSFPLSASQFRELEKDMEIIVRGKIEKIFPSSYGDNSRAMVVDLRGTIIETEE